MKKIILFLAIITTACESPDVDRGPTNDAGLVDACYSSYKETYCAAVLCSEKGTIDNCGNLNQPSDCPLQCGDESGHVTCTSLFNKICNGICGVTVQEDPRCGDRSVVCPPCGSK